MSIDDIIDRVLQAEGSAYTNHPSDRGGPTKWGITQHTLSSYLGRPASIGDVMSLTEAVARTIYVERYVIKPGFAAVNAIAPKVAFELVDTGVNMGPGVPSRWLQEWLNALNRQGRDWPDLKVDGDVGPATLNALRRLLAVRGTIAGEKVLVRGLNCSQGAKYLQLAQGRQANEDFMFGWLLHRVTIDGG